jgi:hypothetical protein
MFGRQTVYVLLSKSTFGVCSLDLKYLTLGSSCKHIKSFKNLLLIIVRHLISTETTLEKCKNKTFVLIIIIRFTYKWVRPRTYTSSPRVLSHKTLKRWFDLDFFVPFKASQLAQPLRKKSQGLSVFELPAMPARKFNCQKFPQIPGEIGPFYKIISYWLLD